MYLTLCLIWVLVMIIFCKVVVVSFLGGACFIAWSFFNWFLLVICNQSCVETCKDTCCELFTVCFSFAILIGMTISFIGTTRRLQGQIWRSWSSDSLHKFNHKKNYKKNGIWLAFHANKYLRLPSFWTCCTIIHFEFLLFSFMLSNGETNILNSISNIKQG